MWDTAQKWCTFIKNVSYSVSKQVFNEMCFNIWPGCVVLNFLQFHEHFEIEICFQCFSIFILHVHKLIITKY